jgi:hypothetical protein
MKRYRIIAIYHAEVELEIEIEDDEAEPSNPANWDTFVSEHQRDFNLYDVQSVEEVEEF